MDVKQEAARIYKEMLEDLTKSPEGKEAWEKAQDLLKGSLLDLATAKARTLYGDEKEKRAASVVIKYSSQAIEDIKDALSSKLSTYLVDKVISELRAIVMKFLLPALV